MDLEGWLSWLNWGWLPNWLSSGGWLGSEAGLVTSQKSGLLVRGVEGVDEGVNSSTVGTGRDTEVLGSGGGGGLGGEVGSVGVESKVTVGWVVGVDEWVEVGVHRFVNIVVVNRGRGGLDNWGSWLDGGGYWGGLLGTEGGGVLSVGTSWDVGSL